MSKVYRIYVEKRKENAVEANEIKHNLIHQLGMTDVKNVTVINRYDVQGISEEVLEQGIPTILSEPMVDDVYKEEYHVPNGAFVFGIEYLPGQYDQRADACEQCFQLLTEQKGVKVRCARLFVIEGVVEDELPAIKSYLINPVDSRECSLAKPEHLDDAQVNIKKKLLGEFDLHTVIRLPGSVFAPYTSITTNILFFDRTHPTEETWFYRLDMPEGYKHFSKTKPMKAEHFAPAVEWWENRREIAEDGFPKAKKFTARQLAEDLGYNFDQCGYPHAEEEILDPLDLIQRYQEERASLNAEIDRVLAEITAILGGTRE